MKIDIETAIIETNPTILKIGFEKVYEIITTPIKIQGLNENWMISVGSIKININ